MLRHQKNPMESVFISTCVDLNRIHTSPSCLRKIKTLVKNLGFCLSFLLGFSFPVKYSDCGARYVQLNLSYPNTFGQGQTGGCLDKPFCLDNQNSHGWKHAACQNDAKAYLPDMYIGVLSQYILYK